MTPADRQRLFDPSVAFDHPATGPLLVGVGIALLIPPIVLGLGRALGFMPATARRDVWKKYLPWPFLTVLLGVPVLLGAFWTVLGVAVLGFLCFREYARATGLFREKMVSYLTLLAMLLVYLAALDAWFRLFQALFPLGVAGLAGLTILQDRPKGYVQRVALAVFAFALFGACLGHAAYATNHRDYRPLILLFLFAVELNDVLAFTAGRLFGRRQLCPNTNPAKTVAGALGAVIGTTALMVLAGKFVFAGTGLDDYARLAVLGILVSVSGQMGTLMLASVKRDVGIKDMDVIIPGHGGLLDRFDSALLVAPVAFHYVNFFAGPGPDPPLCVFTGAR